MAGKRAGHAVRQSLRAGLYGHRRADRRYKEAYDYCAQQMQDALRPEDQYRLSSPYDLHECETTLSIEQTIIHALVTQLLEESTTLDREAFKKLLSERQSKYWCQTRQEYCAIYDALRQAERLLNLRNRHIDGFHYQDSATFWKAYCEELFRFDQPTACLTNTRCWFTAKAQ